MPKKVDRNQPEIVRALRSIGASVQTLHAVGKGVPDLLVWFRGQYALLEVKDHLQPPSKRRLTDDEADWHTRWQGPVHIVSTIEEAFAAVGVLGFGGITGQPNKTTTNERSQSYG